MGYVMHGSKGWWVSVGKQQWGFSANPVTYPIAFNKKTLLVCGLTFDQQSTHSPNLYQNLTTKTGFPWERYTGVGSYKVSYIAFGYQQWGTSTSEKTKTFPIAFSNSCYSVLNIMNVNSNRYENPYVIDVTASSFKSGLSGVNYAMYWIAVGKQQWGEYIPTNANLGYRITLPITYSSSTSYIVVCSNDDTTNSYICTSAAKRIDEKQIDLASAINGDFYQTQPVSIICLGF